MTSSPEPIPFNRPTLVGAEREYMADAIARHHISGDGHYSRQCHALLEQLHSAPRALLTTNCTHALELAALLLDIAPGDEIILPSFTFVSTVNAFVLRGARPVFADVREDTLNLDERLLESLITPRTRAIVPVHYAGIACEMDAIVDIAGRHGVAIVEDNAHGLLGGYRGRPLGTFSAMSTLSFHETKNFTCGEGGALVINDPALVARAEILREKGTNRSQFFRGQVDKYTWVDVGSSYLPSDLLAAMLLAQLEQRDAVQAKRRAIFERYYHALGPWSDALGVRRPALPPQCQPAYHLFFLIMPSLEMRTALLEHLRARGIGAVFHYLALNSSPMGRRFGGVVGGCPVAEAASDRLIRLPFFYELSEAQQERVIDAVTSFGD